MIKEFGLKILYCGDVVGRAGRGAVVKHIAEIRKKYDVDVLGKLGGEVKGSVPFEVLPQEI